MAATAELPTGLVEPRFNIWVGPGRHFVAYPVRRGELINYVALVEEEGWSEESWTTKADNRALAATYEQARRERTTAVQTAAWEQGQLNHAVGRGSQGDSLEGGQFSDPGWTHGHDVVATFP